MSENNPTGTALFLKPSKPVIIMLLILFLAAGFGVRMIDYDDLPLDFAVTRQLHSLIMARGYYYQMDTPDTLSMPQDLRQFGITKGNSESQIEPPIFEKLVAFTYRLLGGENILVFRLFSILFWVIGGIPLFFLSRKLMSVNGAFAALAVYLFTPFAVIASRSFQPDPLMVMLILWALYFQVEWAQKDTLKWALLAGIFTGLSLFVKIPAAFFVGFTMVGLVISRGVKNSLRNWRVWMIAALGLVPALVFNYISATVGGNAGAIFGARFFPNLFTDPKWYFKWLMLAKSVVGYFPILIALLGYFFLKTKQHKIFYFCMWLGYLLYGFMFAYHIYTHNYYHLPLIPIVAIGFGLVFSALFSKLEEVTSGWPNRSLVMVVFGIALGLCFIQIRSDLLGASYRHEAKYWQELGEKIGRNASVIALTHDYGYRISYWGFVNPTLWPTQSDLTVKDLIGSTDPAFEELFKLKTEGKNYFLVTLINDFKSQANLYEYLFAHYPYTEGDGYYLFDLTSPLGTNTE